MQYFAIAEFNNWFIIHKIIEVLEQSAWITSSTFFNLVFNLQILKCKLRHHSINNFNKTACSYNNTVHVFLNKKQLLKENWTLKSSLSYLIKLSFNFWFPCFVLEIFQFLWYANYTYDVVYDRGMLYIFAIIKRNHFEMYMFGVVGETHARDYFEVISFYNSKDIQHFPICHCSYTMSYVNLLR